MTSRLDAIKARAEAATGGPWRVQLDGFDYGPWDEVYVDNARGECPCTPCGVSNAEFIAHARSDVPVLVAAVKAVLAISRETERDDLGYDDQAVDNSWVAGYNAALVDVRAAIQAALGEGEK